MAVGKKGEKKISNTFPKPASPNGPKTGPSTFNSGKGPLGMRQTYKQTGKPGNGSK